MSPSPPHPRSVSISVQKGGAGKTSISSHVAALAAERGYRVLAVDLDPQGNLGRDLGYWATDADDQGEALFEAVALNRPLRVAAGVRENLDVVVGGEKVEMLAQVVTNREPRERMISLRDALAGVWHDYDLVVLDSPPLIRSLREMGLAACRYAVVPTRGDSASVDGVTGIAKDFARVREVNPDLELLGVVLFGMGTASKSVRHQVRSTVAEGLGTIAPVFETVIRYVESPAINARNSGLLVHEYAAKLAAAARFTDRKRGVTANKLAADYAALTAELLRAMADHDQAAEPRETAVTGAW